MESSLDQSIPLTPDDLSEMEKMSSENAARILTARARFIDRQDRVNFAEKGMIAEYLERRSLFQCVDNPQTGLPCTSQNEWIEAFCPFSRSSWFDAKRRWKELEDVPAADRIQIPRSNLIVMQKCSTAVRRDASVIEAAKTMPEAQFVEMVNRAHPTQHLESRKDMRIKPEASAHRVIEEAIQLAMRRGAKTQEEAFEDMAQNYIDDFREEYDAMFAESA
jgi:hypothetical protein